MNETQRTLFNLPLRWTQWCIPGLLICVFAAVPIWSSATAPEVTPPTTPAVDPIEELTEIMVEAPEPRYGVREGHMPGALNAPWGGIVAETSDALPVLDNHGPEGLLINAGNSNGNLSGAFCGSLAADQIGRAHV